MVAGFCHSLPPAARSIWGILKGVCVCASCVTQSTVRLNKGLAYGAEGQVQGFACRSALHTIGDHSARVLYGLHMFTQVLKGDGAGFWGNCSMVKKQKCIGVLCPRSRTPIPCGY